MSLGLRHWYGVVALTACSIVMVGCGSDEESYPPVIDNFADISTDSKGHFVTMTLDDGSSYAIANEPSESTYRPDTTYRAVAGYTLSEGNATLYRLSAVAVLADSTACAKYDPLNVVSVWRAGNYINLHLVALTHHERPHFVGYALTSHTPAGGERAHGHLRLGIHHDQNGDPASFSANAYCSIRANDVGPWEHVGDTLSITVHTFDGDKVWSFVR